MKKHDTSAEITALNRATFRVSADQLRGGRLAQCVEESLARILGGAGPPGADPARCSTYVCTTYIDQ